MIEDGGANGPGCDVRRNDYSRDTDPPQLEVKWWSDRGDVIGRRQRNGRNVVKDAAALIVDDDERARVPQSIVLSTGVVHILNECFTVAHVVIGMLVGGGKCRRLGLFAGLYCGSMKQ